MNPTLEPCELAIVIPAYKAQYLRAALQSIAAQTDRRFRLYVGDDGSPEPLEQIVQEFTGQMPLHYHRFEQNLGGVSLVKHWERCLRLTKEPWVWLFSDDDLMAENCVAAFLQELSVTRGKYDLYRFNTTWMRESHHWVEPSPEHPREESGVEFLVARLQATRRSTLQELIFSRAAWEAAGGIPDFPLAWASDDALIGLLGRHRPICTIPGPRITWRLSDVNISSDNTPRRVRAKLQASEAFIRWMLNYYEQLPAADRKWERRELCRWMEAWLFAFTKRSRRFMGISDCWQIERISVRLCGRPPGYALARVLWGSVTLFVVKCVENLQRIKNKLIGAK